MKVKTLSLTNYRGFDGLEINFHRRLNVIAGINGVGKSSLLHALQVAFSRALPQMTAATSGTQKFDDDDIKEGSSVFDLGLSFDIHGEAATITMQRVQVSDERKAEWQTRLDDIEQHRMGSSLSRIPRHLQEEQRTLRANLDGDRDIYHLALENVQTDAQRQDAENVARGDHTKTQRTGGLDDVERKTADMLRAFREQENQPLVVYYAPLRFTASRVRTLPEGSPLGTARAFDQALEEREINFREFLHWYRWLEQDDNKATKRQRNVLLKTLQKAVTDFIPEFKEFKLQEKPKLKFLVLKDTQWLSLEQLSDGERGLIGLVLDIARRLALANPAEKEPLKAGRAVVLIDEVELHLHPQWQRQVMAQLEATFPSCQFIVTSHSPQVIGQVAADRVRLLKNDEGRTILVTPSESFGMESGWVLENLMETPARDPITQDKIEKAYSEIDNDDLEAAKRVVDSLEGKIGSDPELKSIKAIISRLELLMED